MAGFPAPAEVLLKELLLVRHAAAAGKRADSADRDRSLTPEGRRAAHRLGQYLRSNGISPDHVLCSPARRARETLDGIAETLDRLPPADFDDRLYLAGSLTLLEHLHDAPAETQCLLLIGHNPGLEELVRALADPATAAVRAGLPAAGLAIFRVSSAWSGLSQASARLASFLTP
jgi:phosphohistidine phosphatase